jgi:polyhydroxybutyrate depolymerase
MYRHDFHHERAFRTKRLLAWICVAFSLLLVIGVFFYSFQTGILTGIISGLAGKNAQRTLISNDPHANCPNHPTGNRTLTVNSGGVDRNFIVHLPPSYGTQSLPLVFNYHGYDNTAERMAAYTNMGAEADQQNFIVVFPQGALDSAADPKPSWNAGDGAYGPTGNTDDVQFTQDMIHYLEHNYCADSHRIYVTGYSVGGGMAYRVACELSDQIAAVATVEGAFYHIPPNGCEALQPVSFLEIHSLVDILAPYNGDNAKFSVQRILDLWFAIDKCDTSVSRTIFNQADVTATEWPNCANGTAVEHYKISDGGHVWPGSATPEPSLGYTTQTIDSNVVIWNFFSRFKK